MCSVVRELRITGKPDTTLQWVFILLFFSFCVIDDSKVIHRHNFLCNMHGEKKPSWRDLANICQRLGDMRFLKIGGI